MTIAYWKDMSILADSVEIAGHAKSFKVAAECDVLDTTAMATTGWTSCIGGTKSSEFEFEFMQDFADDSLDETFWANVGGADVVRSIVTNSADGSFGYLMRGIALSYTPLEGEPGGLAMGKISGRGSTGPLVRGTLLHPGSASRTTSGAGTARQIGTVSATQRMYASLHVLSVAGTATPTLTVKVQSDDNSGMTSATDRITFTAATAIGSQWGSVVGAVTDDWWRVSYTISGTNPVFSFAVLAGIA